MGGFHAPPSLRISHLQGSALCRRLIELGCTTDKWSAHGGAGQVLLCAASPRMETDDLASGRERRENRTIPIAFFFVCLCHSWEAATFFFFLSGERGEAVGVKHSDRVPSFGVAASGPPVSGDKCCEKFLLLRFQHHRRFFQIYSNGRPVGAAVLLIIALFKLP